jgi:hypothetical protein
MRTNTNKKSFLIISLMILVTAFVTTAKANAFTYTPVRFELSGNPGQTITSKITLINEEITDKTLYSSFRNFEAEGEEGTPKFVESKEGLASWMTVIPKITLASKESKTINFSIDIPSDATPGGYFSAIYWCTTPPGSSGNAQVAIGTCYAPIVLLRVNGNVKEEAQILNFSIDNDQNFFTALPVGMSYRFQNGGADRAKPVGDVTLRNFFGIKAATVDANDVKGNVLPGQIRHFRVTWAKENQNVDEPEPSRGFFEQLSYEWHNFAFGHFTANLAIAYGSQNKTLEADTSFWVIPWQLLIVIIIIALLALWILKKLLTGYNSWIIKKAKMAISHEHDMENPNHEHGNDHS